MMGVHIDVTDQVSKEQMLRDSNAELEQFAFVASHDLQEPLRKVRSFCDLLEDELGDSLTGDCQNYLGYIIDGADRMRILISDLLSFSGVKSEAQPLQNTDCQLALDEALTDLAMVIEESGATIRSDPLPIIWAAPRLLSQLFQNLIGNSIKYSHEQPRIHISCKAVGSQYVICVKDNGIGIKPEYQEKVFGIFKRLHARTEYKGTGIGLAICKRIVERWGGEIYIESDGKSGSAFCFKVPMGRNQAARG